MALLRMLTPNRVLLDVGACRKKEIIGLLAERFARDLGGDALDYADALLAREKLGPTAIGMGIALPHAKIAGIQEPLAAIAIMAEPICFAASNDERVDIVIAVLSPENSSDDVKRLAEIVRELRNAAGLGALRASRSPEELLEKLRELQKDG